MRASRYRDRRGAGHPRRIVAAPAAGERSWATAPAAILLLAGLAAACSSKKEATADGGPPPAASAGSTAAATSSAAPHGPSGALLPRTGNVVARSANGALLYVADEDHRSVRVVPIPVVHGKAGREVTVPGAPAQIVVIGDRVLVTVRDPGLLVVLREAPESELVEVGTVALPSDAWGLAVTPDGKTAIVTSAWTHQISAVDLDSLKKRWSVDVAREPRGVVVRPDGASAYVTHLVGSKLTRLDDLGAAAPRVSRVDLPASPLRAPSGRSLSASLGYAAALSASGDRLFVTRHALGAMGKEAWFGAATVDVLLTANDTPLAPKHAGKLPFLRSDRARESEEIKLPGAPLAPFTQPRAILYRKRTQTVLVASEGDDRVVEFDAVSLDPTLAALKTYTVGAGYGAVPIASVCAAPAGLAMSDDESTAWTFCRGSYDLAEIKLADDPMAAGTPAPPRVVRLAEDPVDAIVSVGRRLFYNASDRITSGGLACAGCHPEGRDDGYVWHEAKFNTQSGTSVNFIGTPEQVPDEERVKGHPRRTPMLAGRVASSGPYGWHGESSDIADRLARGFALHRWGAMPKHEAANLAARSGAIAAFLRKGLVPPPRDEHPLTPVEERGRVVFMSAEAGCARCHVPSTEYTDRVGYVLGKLPKRDDFDDEEEGHFKTPSLSFLAGRAPYFHDGSAASIEDLVEKNGDRMGKTSHLGAADRAALVAFLRTL